MSLDGNLVNYRKHIYNLAVLQGVEGVLMKDDPPSFNRKIEKLSGWRAFEAYSRRNMSCLSLSLRRSTSGTPSLRTYNN